MSKLLAPGKYFAPVKRLAPAIAILAMLIPAVGHALGLGNITMNSALNQPLNAQIELLSVKKGDLSNLVVKLGSEEDFQRVGADRAFFLTKIKFEVVSRKNGTAYVQMSTTPTVTEPFLDFVVEARWPRGRILREFTVLVDPPVLSNEAPAPVQQAAVARQQAAPAATRRAPAPIQSRTTMAPVARRAGELVYGPVKYNDTLYEIANAMRPSGVSVDQMMLALVRNNPKAFYNGNVNQLKAGFVLRVDDVAALSAYSVAEANAEVNRQHSEWRARKSGDLVRQTDAPTGGTVARGEGTGASSAADQASLKLVAPGSKGAGSGAGEDVNQLRQDLLLAAEALDANRQETDELKSRLAEMEEQLEAMQRLIMLKDDEMLTLQTQSGVEPAEAEMSAMDEAADQTAAEALAEDAEMPADAEMPVEGEESAPKPAPVAPVPMEEPGLLDDPMVMYGGLGILLLIIIAVVIQRRRKMQDGFEESILNVGGDGGIGATADNMGGGESSMVSDFAMSEMSGMSGIETDAADVDPISEADVYLAYGRHQQAEDILNEALVKEPGRNELKLKLLEVFFAAKNRESFEQKAQEFHDSLGDKSDPMWVKVVTMGGQLCPGSDLFGGDSAEALKEGLQKDTSGGDDDLLDFDFDIDSDNVDASAATGTTGDAETDEMFAELEAATSDASAATGKAPAAEDSSLDFDMGSNANAKADAKPADDNNLDFDVSSLDFDLDTDTKSGATKTASDDDGSLDFDIGDVDDASGSDDGDLADELDDEAFGEVDEIGTKLDLAKAYVDMGDGDGAKSILDEVMEEGDDAQKKQAKDLLAQLS